ncbi:type II secretion system protein K [Arenicella chitinivorans]|uniref:Type II secretion system protein K n=1 Tax=Arenicella chitinivorans TaxID=1329800 RepID=A0A918RS73_9GAMM|nr:type II secretion system minor pseudopilin GspK [Arenicella chitinivorans]GHA08940.1 type II secretion system protein K [Arenicella chitinivorans]
MNINNRSRFGLRHQPRFAFRSKQAGVVLVVVVAAVVLMVTLLALMIEDQHILVRRLGNQKISDQGFHYAQGVTAWAERVLHEDQNRTVDHLGEKWAKFGRPEPVPEEGEDDSFSLDTRSSREEEEEEKVVLDFGIDGIEYSIDDLQGRYNLNNLAAADKTLVQQQKRIYLNLLEVLEIGEFDERDQLVGALIDWLDENDAISPNGVESGTYASRTVPYYAADQKLTSLGELRFVDGYTEDIINALAPYVTVLPVDNAAININTTTPEVLASLSSAPVTDMGSVTAFLAQREQPGFQGFQPPQLEDAKTAIIRVSVLGAQPASNTMMQVNSQFFQINSKVTLGDYVYCMQTVVLRESATQESAKTPKVSVLSRQHNTLCEDQSTTTNNSDEDISKS